MRTQPRRSRALLAAAVLLVLAALVARWTAGDRAAALRPGATLADLLTALAGLTVLAALGWLVLLTVLLALEGLAGRPLTGWAGCPAGVRRLLLVLCGLATASALAVPADAATGTDAGPTPAPGGSLTASSGSDQATSALLDGLPMPDRPSGAAPRPTSRAAQETTPRPSRSEAPTTTPARAAGADRAAEASARPVPARDRWAQRRTPPRVAAADVRPVAGERYTVRDGDTLWDVAARQLGPAADATATAQAWRLIYAANRDLIGTDPDLIQPGTTLRVPPTVQEDQP